MKNPSQGGEAVFCEPGEILEEMEKLGEENKGVYDNNLSNGIVTPELVLIDGLIYPSPSKLK